MPLATLSTATWLAFVLGSAGSVYITYTLMKRIDRGAYILKHDWLDNILPFVMLVPGVIVGFVIWVIAHVVPSLEVGIPFIFSMLFGLCAGFAAVTPERPEKVTTDDVED